ncbi:outer membrane protein [Legionella beliardensis]|uniref:Outer membrane protein n=1 Tax=Legionella beliardensis TaxID=91822 RepID=A0A378HXN2_9GAMM|nr:outer membrane protein transport protein [Legionella beliardensis]STX27688.1 outer membrane protein [Legionella beliardensis]
MNRKALLTLNGIGLIAFPLALNAAAYQIFPYLAYENPATLNLVQKAEIIGGVLIPTVKFHFSGTNGDRAGTANSKETDYLPYGRGALRLNEQWVASFDITRPMYADIRYPLNSVVNNLVTNTVILDTDFSPKISYEIKKGLAVGVGFNANYLYDAELSFSAPPYGQVANKASNWAYGWNAGISYALSKVTILNASYYSKINHITPGTSAWGPFFSADFSSNLILPATYTLNLIQIFPPKWALSGIVRFLEWKPYKEIFMKNLATSRTLIFPANYNNSWSAAAFANYTLNDKWQFRGGFQYESSPQSIAFRPVGLPTYSNRLILTGIEYAFKKNWSAQLLYGYGFTNPPINTRGSNGPVRGRINIDANIVDLSLKWKV